MIQINPNDELEKIEQELDQLANTNIKKITVLSNVLASF